MSNKIVKLISTFFYVGYFPIASGSLASFLGMLIFFLIRKNIFFYVILLALLTLLGFLTSGKMEEIVGRKDPSCVVIDEVVGMLIALFMLPVTPRVMITAFFLFRAFDMFKIYPVNKFEKLASSVGIMSDDIVAGVYTNIVMNLAIVLSGTRYLF